MFTLGYALREYGAYNYLYDEKHKTTLIMFILSQVFIYICPWVLLSRKPPLLSLTATDGPCCMSTDLSSSWPTTTSSAACSTTCHIAHPSRPSEF